MDKVRLNEERFDKRLVPFPDLSNERVFPGGIQVKVLFEPECKWRLVEEFGPSCFEEQPDGKLLFYGDYTNKENLITWLMTFRDKVILLEPEEMKKEIQLVIQRMMANYLKGSV